VQGLLHFFLKTKTVVSHDDFAFFFLKKKRETGWVEDDFTCNVVHHDDLTLFDKKKKSTNQYLQISLLTNP